MTVNVLMPITASSLYQEVFFCNRLDSTRASIVKPLAITVPAH